MSLRWLYDNISDKYWNNSYSSYNLWGIRYPEETIDKLISMGKTYVVMSNVRVGINHSNHFAPESSIDLRAYHDIGAATYKRNLDGKNGKGSSSGGPYDVNIPLTWGGDKLNSSDINISCNDFYPGGGKASNITYSLTVGSIYFT